MEVYIDDEAKLTLHGLRQHYVKLKDSEKNRKLFELLDVLEFNQVRKSPIESLRNDVITIDPSDFIEENLDGLFLIKCQILFKIFFQQ